MKAVLDTNVLISAHAFPGGAPETVYKLVLTGHLQAVTSPPLLVEFTRVMIEKLNRDPAIVAEAVMLLGKTAQVVRPLSTPPVILADPADDIVLATAAAGDAGVVISGDRHLLRLERWRDVQILTVSDFLKEFPPESRPVQGPH